MNTLQSPFIRMLLAMAIFGSIGYAAGLTALSSFELVFVRCVCATLFLCAIWLLSGQYKKERWQRREVLIVLLSGIFLVFNWVFLFRSFELAPVTVGVSIYYLAPVLVLLIGSALFRERLTWISIGSIISCVVGTALVSGLGSQASLQQWMSSGVLWAFLAAVFYACMTLLSKGITMMSPYAVTMLQTLLGILILPPFVHFGAFGSLTGGNWATVAVIGVIHTGIVYYFYFSSVRALPARTISALAFLDPGIAIVLDILISGFRPSLPQAAGILLTFAGMAMSFLGSSDKERENPQEG
ncbi:drug/metabolite transporter (DMT)-like permease [Paenibacillus phyllosphaerae]|uniref:Drug/metabolite transporter (DMT)-like permease n=1 Tax=Paenibacillus phyllosphaerae TaxID=274593 RepID=A0A7W5B3Q8_9BACL|nr:DMT family transporter [Paenibacillus phyllosphaerae]MBB3113870.1 drug/metabolite transporter (DMT)-like permease [Paenibacillus phyllosphaerae]